MRRTCRTAELRHASHLLAASLLVALLGPHGALAQQTPARVLVLCTDGSLGPDAGCDALHEAVVSELSGLDLQVSLVELAAQAPADDCAVPPGVVQATSLASAASAAWVAAGDADGAPVLYVYTPASVQALSSIPLVADAGGTPDLHDAAFRLRTLLAAALYLDVPGIEGDAMDMPPGLGPPAPVPEPTGAAAAPAVAPPVVSEPWPPGPELEAEVSPHRSWVAIDAGYLLTGYPTRRLWYHGLGLAVGVKVLPDLELFVDAGVTAPQSTNLGVTLSGQAAWIHNAQYILGLGLGYHVRVAGPFSIMPRAGVHLGVSDSKLDADGTRRYRQLNASVWAGLELEVTLHSWLALHAGLNVENLFNYEYFEVIEGADSSRVFGLAQLRMGVTMGLTANF